MLVIALMGCDKDTKEEEYTYNILDDETVELTEYKAEEYTGGVDIPEGITQEEADFFVDLYAEDYDSAFRRDPSKLSDSGRTYMTEYVNNILYNQGAEALEGIVNSIIMTDVDKCKANGNNYAIEYVSILEEKTEYLADMLTEAMLENGVHSVEEANAYMEIVGQKYQMLAFWYALKVGLDNKYNFSTEDSKNVYMSIPEDMYTSYYSGNSTYKIEISECEKLSKMELNLEIVSNVDVEGAGLKKGDIITNAEGVRMKGWIYITIWWTRPEGVAEVSANLGGEEFIVYDNAYNPYVIYKLTQIEKGGLSLLAEADGKTITKNEVDAIKNRIGYASDGEQYERYKNDVRRIYNKYSPELEEYCDEETIDEISECIDFLLYGQQGRDIRFYEIDLRILETAIEVIDVIDEERKLIYSDYIDAD